MLIAIAVPLLVCLAATVVGHFALRRFLDGLDPAESIGVAGLAGLGLLGTLTVFVGMVPGSLRYSWAMAGLLVVVAGAMLFNRGLGQWRFTLPTGAERWVALGLAGLCLFPLLETFNPGTMMEWDSFAYHLAVPKSWVEAGQVGPIETIHHSNFPFAIDGLQIYMVGLGLTAQRLVSFAVFLLGATALFGHVRRHRTGAAGWWAALAFAASPVVLWESGTAYIDVSHGLFVGLGALYAAEGFSGSSRQNGLPGLAVLTGLMLGLGMGTKFTGIQSFGIAGLLAVVGSARHLRLSWKPLATAAALAVVVSAPWFVKTFAYTGNPVFPFFYEQFGGKGWNQWRADIYREEQRSFGVGRTAGNLDPAQFGHAVLGLAYQPGRYTNPGQSIGAGFPTQSIGFLCLATFLLVAATGTKRRETRFVLLWALLSLCAWFVLSQQSRYLTSLVVPAAALLGLHLGGRVARFALPALAVLQAVTSAWLMVETKAVSGIGQPPAVPFAPMAKELDGMPDVKKVALYDEVFGYFINKPYMWANPGHSDKFDADSPDGLLGQLRASGITHVYQSLAFTPPDQRERLLNAVFVGTDYAMSEAEQADPNLRWKGLLASLVRDGKLRPQLLQNRAVLYAVQP